MRNKESDADKIIKYLEFCEICAKETCKLYGWKFNKENDIRLLINVLKISEAKEKHEKNNRA